MYALLEEIFNNVVPHWSAVLISPNNSIARLISFTKSASNRRSLLSEYGPRGDSHLSKNMGMKMSSFSRRGAAGHEGVGQLGGIGRAGREERGGQRGGGGPQQARVTVRPTNCPKITQSFVLLPILILNRRSYMGLP